MPADKAAAALFVFRSTGLQSLPASQWMEFGWYVFGFRCLAGSRFSILSHLIAKLLAQLCKLRQPTHSKPLEYSECRLWHNGRVPELVVESCLHTW